ncbi:MAG: DUF2442 domain-containing protein [Bacteroidetes bacterium]|nr:DUF2442 domain-containing protein [Bacteroidota bacterium]
MFEYIAKKIWFDESYIYTELTNGKIGKMPLDWFPLLKNATPIQRNNFEIINGYAAHWKELDEDLSIEGFFKFKK